MAEDSEVDPAAGSEASEVDPVVGSVAVAVGSEVVAASAVEEAG